MRAQRATEPGVRARARCRGKWGGWAGQSYARAGPRRTRVLAAKRERGAVAEAGPGARHNAPLCVARCAKRPRAATHNGRRYVDWPLRRDQVHGPSLSHKRDGQLPGPAEKTAAVSEAATDR